MLRIYVVREIDGKGARLVEAASKSAALAKIATEAFDVFAASPNDVATLMSSGVSVERVERTPTLAERARAASDAVFAESDQ